MLIQLETQSRTTIKLPRRGYATRIRFIGAATWVALNLIIPRIADLLLIRRGSAFYFLQSYYSEPSVLHMADRSSTPTPRKIYCTLYKIIIIL